MHDRPIPMRVSTALKKAKDFDEFRRSRPFKFLHMYSGPNDPLGQASQVEVAKNRLEVVILPLDKKLDKDLDLTSHKSHKTMLQDVREGEWDYYVHAGFPCGSLPRARHHKALGQPGPVRGKANICGDGGTRMAVQAGEVYKAHIMCCQRRKLRAWKSSRRRRCGVCLGCSGVGKDPAQHQRRTSSVSFLRV